MAKTPDCYKCEYRRDLQWDAHSWCEHPAIGKLNITGDPWGIKHGWFTWPINFDPIWLESCDGFTPKKGETDG